MECIIDKLKINYADEGQGEAVLILHGWGSNIQAFNYIANELKEKRRIIRVDMPGFGESDMPKEPWNVDMYVDFIIKFISKIGLDKLTLIGHSFGGRVIIKLFSKDKLNFYIDKVVLIDSAGILPKKSFKSKIRLKVFKCGKKVLLLKPVKNMFPNALDKFRGLFGSSDYNNASGVMRDTLVRVVNEDLEVYLKYINVPTLLIWGDKDTATPLSDGQKMEAVIKDSGLVIVKNAGHFSFIDDSYLVVSVLKSFLFPKENV